MENELLKRQIKSIIVPDDLEGHKERSEIQSVQFSKQSVADVDRIHAKAISANLSSDLSGMEAPFKITGTQNTETGKHSMTTNQSHIYQHEFIEAG